MKEIEKYNKARQEIEQGFMGLPHGPSQLVYLLISRANPKTGLVHGLSYRDLASLLSILPASGRKEVGMPEKHVVRSYLKTIEKQCGNDFQILSEGTQLKFKFLKMSVIYAKYFYFSPDVSTVDLTDLSTEEHHINKDDKAHYCCAQITEESSDVSTEESTDEPSVKKCFIYNKTNKQNTTGAGVREEEVKKAISYDFKPSYETKALALSLGLSRVLDTEEIQKFIDYNLSCETTWEDYNPVFLGWLKRDAEYRRVKEAKQKQQKTRRAGNESSNSNNSFAGSKPRTKQTFEELMQAVSQCNPNPLAPSETDLFALPPINFENFDPLNCLTHGVALEAINEHLQSAVY